MAAVITLLHFALIAFLAWMIGRALVTGEITVRWRVMRRGRNPVGYWFGIALGCFLLFVWGGPLVRQAWNFW